MDQLITNIVLWGFGLVFLVYFIGVIVACAFNYSNKQLEGVDGLPYSKMFNPVFIVGVFIALTVNKIYGRNRFIRHLKQRKEGLRRFGILYLIPDHLAWQYCFRLTAKDCQPCYDAKKCSRENCGCDPNAKALVPWEKCGGKQWDQMKFFKKNLTERDLQRIEYAKDALDFFNN